MKPGTPLLTVDGAVSGPGGKILLVRRGRPPFRGAWALPGGFVEIGETVEEACAREVREETGVAVAVGPLVGVYSRPGRDPRGHTVSVVLSCRALDGKPSGGDDASEARWFSPREAASLTLAFDHAEIVANFLRWRRRRPSGGRAPRRSRSARRRTTGAGNRARRTRRRAR